MSVVPASRSYVPKLHVDITHKKIPGTQIVFSFNNSSKKTYDDVRIRNSSVWRGGRTRDHYSYDHISDSNERIRNDLLIHY